MIAFGKCKTCMCLKGSTDNLTLMDSTGRFPFWGPVGPLSGTQKPRWLWDNRRWNWRKVPDVEKDESYVRFLIKVIFCHSFYTFYTIESTHCFEYCWPLQLWPWLWAMNIQDQCADCGKEFRSGLCFNKHYREYHQKNESNWQCQQRLWKSNRGQGLLWCDPGLRGWSTGGSSQGHLGCLRQNKHFHPLIYMRGMKSDDLFAIVDNWAISKMVFGKNLSGSNPLENMTYPLFSSPTFYMSGQVCVKY